ncbi:hypothetical protein [Paracidovorax wautersii]|uniref:hypothetical protein n=1 Tax=Paracidovorax wautersii TaxID=1177982 RepID=UPI0031D9343C
MQGLSLISGSASFSRTLGVDVPFADRLLAGNVCGRSVRDTKRSVRPAVLMPSAFRGAPTIGDVSMLCSVGNGLRLPIALPQDYTVVAVLRNHIRPIGGLNPVLADFGRGTAGPQYVNGSGLGLQGAGGSMSAVSFFQGAGDTKQGAYLSIQGQDGGLPMFVAATMDDTTSRVHVGIARQLQTSQVTVTGRNPGTWADKPVYLGTDARASGDPAMDAAYAPEVFFGLVYGVLTTAEVAQLYDWAADYVAQAAGMSIN